MDFDRRPHTEYTHAQPQLPLVVRCSTTPSTSFMGPGDAHPRPGTSRGYNSSDLGTLRIDGLQCRRSRDGIAVALRSYISISRTDALRLEHRQPLGFVSGKEQVGRKQRIQDFGGDDRRTMSRATPLAGSSRDLRHKSHARRLSPGAACNRRPSTADISPNGRSRARWSADFHVTPTYEESIPFETRSGWSGRKFGFAVQTQNPKARLPTPRRLRPRRCTGHRKE